MTRNTFKRIAGEMRARRINNRNVSALYGSEHMKRDIGALSHHLWRI